MEDKYIPLACGLYDRLESVSVLRKVCEIKYFTEGGETLTVTQKIIDIKSENKTEYLVLEDKTAIRLDRIISVDGEPFSGSTC